MIRKEKESSPPGLFSVMLVLLSVAALEMGYTMNAQWYGILLITVPLLIAGSTSTGNRKRSVPQQLSRRNLPRQKSSTI
jgi:hypothetical protein